MSYSSSSSARFRASSQFWIALTSFTTGDLCTDPEGRWAALYDAEAIVLEQAVIFPLYGQCNAEMISSAVTGVEHHPCALNRVYKRTVKNA